MGKDLSGDGIVVVSSFSERGYGGRNTGIFAIHGVRTGSERGE